MELQSTLNPFSFSTLLSRLFAALFLCDGLALLFALEVGDLPGDLVTFLTWNLLTDLPCNLRLNLIRDRGTGGSGNIHTHISLYIMTLLFRYITSD